MERAVIMPCYDKYCVLCGLPFTIAPYETTGTAWLSYARLQVDGAWTLRVWQYDSYGSFLTRDSNEFVDARSLPAVHEACHMNPELVADRLPVARLFQDQFFNARAMFSSQNAWLLVKPGKVGTKRKWA